MMKFKFDYGYGCRHPHDGIMGVTDVIIGKKAARLCKDTAMWAKVALSLPVVLVLLCSLLSVTPSVLVGVYGGFPGGSQRKRRV